MSRRPEAPGAVALGVAVFLSGAALLGIEIVASRVLAPSFGSSLYVWGSLIGVVLSGLAIGYWAGGVLSDRFPTPYLLTGTLTLGAARDPRRRSARSPRRPAPARAARAARRA